MVRRYDGSWVRDERHGHGVLAHESVGYLYVGQWQHNKKSGEGHLYSRNERYWGQFLDNKYHGKVGLSPGLWPLLPVAASSATAL